MILFFLLFFFRLTNMAGRRFTRPRTRVYDYNYNLGENYYRSALDGLDRKYGTLPVDTIEVPKRPERPERPASMGDFDSFIEDRKLEAESLRRNMEEDSQSLKRISRARAREAPNAEADFENAFLQRREEVKKRFSDKMLDAVGINGSALDEESRTIRRRARRAAEMAEEEKIKLPVAKWTAMTDHPEDALDDFAAKSRARLSRARLADIDSEMEEISARGAQRERRLANLRDLLSESSEMDSSSASLRMRKTVVTTTEKRTI